MRNHNHFSASSAKTMTPSLLGFAVLLCLVCFSANGSAQNAIGPGKVVVHTALGGFILGYDIDHTGTEGILSESLTLPDGHFNVAVETFDQKTGKILKIINQRLDTKSDFVTLGIFGTSTGLVEFEHVSNLFVDKRLYAMVNPLTANKFTAKWTPQLTKDDIIVGMGASQGSANTAVLAIQNTLNGRPFVFSSNVAANTFGPQISLSDPNFLFGVPPVMDYDSQTNQAVLAQDDGGVLSMPTIGLVDLTTGTQTTFAGLGFGFVNGIAVDSATGTACTTTEIDFSVEFYNLATHTGIIVPLHGATNQLQSGGAVAFDPIHKLFLVGQEFSSTAPSGSSIQVFDEQGNFIEAINGLSLPASPAFMALRPSGRTGFVIVTPALTSLQSFTY